LYKRQILRIIGVDDFHYDLIFNCSKYISDVFEKAK